MSLERSASRSNDLVPLIAASDLAHLYEFNAKQGSQFAQLRGLTADADGAVVRGSLRTPFLNKVASANGKTITAIRIANFKNRAGHRLALGNHKSQFAIAGFGHCQQRYRTV